MKYLIALFITICFLQTQARAASHNETKPTAAKTSAQLIAGCDPVTGSCHSLATRVGLLQDTNTPVAILAREYLNMKQAPINVEQVSKK